MEEYIREFKQLQIRSGIEEEPEQTMPRFLRGLEPSINERVDIQPYWSFEDVCKLAIKVENYSKGIRLFGSSYTKLTTPPKPHIPSKPKMAPKEAVNKDKGKVIVKEFPRQLDGKRCFKCQGYGHFQADCPNRRVLTLKQIEEIDQFASTLDEEEEVEEDAEMVLAPDVGELIVLRRILHVKESYKEESQREHIFHSRGTIQGKVCSLIIDGGIKLREVVPMLLPLN